MVNIISQRTVVSYRALFDLVRIKPMSKTTICLLIQYTIILILVFQCILKVGIDNIVKY